MRQIVLDTETTGLRAGFDRIIELGAVEIVDRKIGAEFHSYFCPRPITVDPQALTVHGLTDEFLDDKPCFREVLPQFREFVGCVGETEFIIHNADFDCRFLNIEWYGGLGAEDDLKRFKERWQVVDTLKLARTVCAGKRSYSLNALAAHYGIEGRGDKQHGALLDARILARVYLAMTSGQEAMTLEAGAPALGPLSTLQRVPRTVYLASPEEIAAHSAFCKAHNIPVL